MHFEIIGTFYEGSEIWYSMLNNLVVAPNQTSVKCFQGHEPSMRHFFSTIMSHTWSFKWQVSDVVVKGIKVYQWFEVFGFTLP